MQYSLRWILAATAFTHGGWYFGDILWGVSALAAVYAVVLACFARGQLQAEALGFVTASLCVFLWVQFGEGDVLRSGDFYSLLPNGSDFSISSRVASAVGMMAFGLMGCFVGALAFRAAKSAG